MRTSEIAVIALLALGLPGVARADDWLGPDKALHFGVSTGLGFGGYAISATFTESEPPRAIIGASFSLSLGIAKELYDWRFGGDASWKDFAWDAAGTTVGVLTAWLIDHFIFDCLGCD